MPEANHKPQNSERPARILVATFPGPYSLDAAVQEMRRMGLPADSIGYASSDHTNLLSVFPPDGRQGTEVRLTSLRVEKTLNQCGRLIWRRIWTVWKQALARSRG